MTERFKNNIDKHILTNEKTNAKVITVLFEREGKIQDKKCTLTCSTFINRLYFFQFTYLTSSGNLLKVISAVVGNPESITCPTSLSFP